MGLIRTATALLATIAVAASASTAHAQGYFVARPATRAEQATAVRIARDYWRVNTPPALARDGMPLCGSPKLSWARFAVTDSDAAEAHIDGSCRIVFNLGAWLWPLPVHRPGVVVGGDTWPSFCTAVAHEWGHLILGPTYFAAANPTDPGHSPDPRNLMYAVQIHDLPACTQTPDPGSPRRAHATVWRGATVE